MELLDATRKREGETRRVEVVVPERDLVVVVLIGVVRVSPILVQPGISKALFYQQQTTDRS